MSIRVSERTAPSPLLSFHPSIHPSFGLNPLSLVLSHCISSKAQTLKSYLEAVRVTLDAALCLRNFASQMIERHNKPEVEAVMNRELLLQPLVVSRHENERVLIEGSINSVRVRCVPSHPIPSNPAVPP